MDGNDTLYHCLSKPALGAQGTYSTINLNVKLCFYRIQFLSTNNQYEYFAKKGR